MRRLLIVFVTLAFELSAQAQEVCLGAEPRRAVIQHEGHSGIWFSHDVAVCLLQFVELSIPRRAEIALLRQRLELSDARAAALVTALERERLSATRVAASLAQAQSALERAMPSWWEHPALWGIVGLVVGAVGSAMVVVAVAR